MIWKEVCRSVCGRRSENTEQDLRHEGRRLADDEHDNDDNQHERDVVVLRLTAVLAPHL